MGTRRKGRELALKFLFQLDIAGERTEEEVKKFFSDGKTPREVEEFARRLALGTIAHREELDGLISAHSDNWRLNRMAVVDRNILRIGVYEFLYEEETPKRVVINEAIEIAKRYGSADSAQFVNGILDAVRRSLEKGDLDEER
jgi:transcription antitermination factor NusB